MFTVESKSQVLGFERELPVVYDRGVVQLSRAVICIDCEGISETSTVCPCCGSNSLLSLARILNREVA